MMRCSWIHSLALGASIVGGCSTSPAAVPSPGSVDAGADAASDVATSDGAPADHAAAGDEAIGDERIESDGWTDGPSDDAPNAECPSVAPGDGGTCTRPAGCEYGTTCCYCAAATGCGGQELWACASLAPADANCPASPPGDGTPCSTRVSCSYCLAAGLLVAGCNQVQWSIAYAMPACR